MDGSGVWGDDVSDIGGSIGYDNDDNDSDDNDDNDDI